MSRTSDRGFLALLTIQSSKMFPLLISNMSLATSDSAALRNFADTWSGKPLHMLSSSYTANPTLQHSLATPQRTTGSISASWPKCCRVLPLSQKGRKKKDERRKMDTGRKAGILRTGFFHQSPRTPHSSLWHWEETGHTKALKISFRHCNRLCLYPELNKMS